MARPKIVNHRDYGQIEQSGAVFDPLEYVFIDGKFLINTARGMRQKHARSYRGFLVGAATISLDGRRRSMASFAGANSKPHAEADKKCAEMDAIWTARSDSFGYHYTQALFVVGTGNREKIKEVTGRDTPTLHPCDPCRTLFEESTVVVTVSAEEDLFEVHTGRELFDYYANPKMEQQHDAIFDPGFSRFTAAHAMYAESVRPYLDELPESATRSIRAEAVVQALRWAR